MSATSEELRFTAMRSQFWRQAPTPDVDGGDIFFLKKINLNWRMAAWAIPELINFNFIKVLTLAR